MKTPRILFKGNYLEVDKEKLGPIIFSKKERNQNNIVVLGPKGGEIEIFKKDGSFRKLFTNSFKEALGPSAKEIVAKSRKDIREERQRLIEAEKQLKELERNAVKLEMQNLRTKSRKLKRALTLSKENKVQIVKANCKG